MSKLKVENRSGYKVLVNEGGEILGSYYIGLTNKSILQCYLAGRKHEELRQKNLLTLQTNKS